MKRFLVKTIDQEYEDVKKADVPIKSYVRRGRSGRQTYVSGYTQQRITRTDVSKITERMTETGGFSWRPWGKEVPESGFMLGVKGHGEEIGDGSKVTNIMSWLKRERVFVKEHEARYFGGWIDRPTGKIYLDVSLNETDREKAIQTARETKEIAIWDVEKSEEVRV